MVLSIAVSESDKRGFIVDYLAEILRSMRNYDYSARYQNHFILSSDISTRDRDAIHKTFSGLMKILFPNGRATKQEIEELLRFSMEGRKRVKDQLFRLDSTYAEVHFVYDNSEGISQAITTLEEEEYPAYYYQKLENQDSETTSKTVKCSDPKCAIRF